LNEVVVTVTRAAFAHGTGQRLAGSPRSASGSLVPQNMGSGCHWPWVSRWPEGVALSPLGTRPRVQPFKCRSCPRAALSLVPVTRRRAEPLGGRKVLDLRGEVSKARARPGPERGTAVSPNRGQGGQWLCVSSPSPLVPLPLPEWPLDSEPFTRGSTGSRTSRR
jgi:hypothetical protein